MAAKNMKAKEWVQNRLPKTAGGWIKLLVAVLAVAALVALTVWLIPWVISLKDEAGRRAFEEYIHEQGAWGVLILIGIQILQVVIAVIPGEPIEVVAGLLYGTFWGYVYCTIGMLTGTVLIFYTIRFFGKNAIQAFADSRKLERFRFLHDTHRLKMVTFLLFFIPGTPKDVLTYFMPLTKIRPLTFFVIVTVARIPSIVSSTFMGDSIGNGQWIRSIIIFLVIGLLGLIGIWFNDVFIKRIETRRAQKRGQRIKK